MKNKFLQLFCSYDLFVLWDYIKSDNSKEKIYLYCFLRAYIYNDIDYGLKKLKKLKVNDSLFSDFMILLISISVNDKNYYNKVFKKVKNYLDNWMIDFLDTFISNRTSSIEYNQIDYNKLCFSAFNIDAIAFSRYKKEFILKNHIVLNQNEISQLYYSLYESMHNGDPLIVLDTFDKNINTKILFHVYLLILDISISSIRFNSNHLARLEQVYNLIPDDIEIKDYLLVYSLIYGWINGDYSACVKIIKNNSDIFKEKSFNRVLSYLMEFFSYINKLGPFVGKNIAFYLERQVNSTLYVVGESHCLSPNKMIFKWLNEDVIAQSVFIIGIKMFHIGNDVLHYSKCLSNNLNTLENNSHLLFTIGEIDTRPDEGIWKKHSNTDDLDKIVNSITKMYIDKLSELLKSHSFKSITIQGIPAPAYSLNGVHDAHRFYEMIENINNQLKKYTLQNNWNFLDVYSATKNQEGSCNNTWKIDNHHLKPSFYQEADKWLIT